MVVCLQGCGNNFNPNNSIKRHKKLVCGTGKAFPTFPCGAITTIEKIIFNLKVRGRKRARVWFWPAPGRGKTFTTTTFFASLWRKYICLRFHLEGKHKGCPQPTPFLLSNPEERHYNHTSHHLKWTFLLIITVMLTLFLCLLLKKEVHCSQIETDQLTQEAGWMNTSCGGWTSF